MPGCPNCKRRWTTTSCVYGTKLIGYTVRAYQRDGKVYHMQCGQTEKVNREDADLSPAFGSPGITCSDCGGWIVKPYTCGLYVVEREEGKEGE